MLLLALDGENRYNESYSGKCYTTGSVIRYEVQSEKIIR